MRFAHTHVWPELLNLQATASSTAFPTSASSKTILEIGADWSVCYRSLRRSDGRIAYKGAFPPNSKEHFLSVSDACFINNLPTLVDPVNEIFLTIGEDVSKAPTFAVFWCAVIIFRTPLGTPARCPRTAIAAAVKGVSAGDFRTTVHPAASA